MMSLRGMLLLGLLVAAAGPAEARTLEVGKGKEFSGVAAAASAAQDGDRILIDDGSYFDCAVLHQNNLTIEGTSEAGTVLTDKACQGKALLVIGGSNVTVRNLTLTRARVPDGNGAGIRAEGRDLLIQHVRFVNDQDGLLAAPQPDGSIIIQDSAFVRNGTCEYSGGCAHGIYVNALKLLRIERTVFRESKQGHQIKSRAARTEVIGCTITDGPTGTSSYQIDIPNGGSLIARGDDMEKGPKSENHTAFIMIGEEGVTQPTPEIVVEDNTARNDGNFGTLLVANQTATEAVLRHNKLIGAIRPLRGDGASD